jgi:hypothetical protein
MALFLADAFGQPTLFEPTGVRSGAMGNCGYALSDDETSLLYNPAGLGLKNDRWNGGALYYSSSDYDYGFINTYYGIAYQNEKAPKIGFSFYLNQFGEINDQKENTVAIGGGYNFYSDDLMANAFGVAIKYYHYQYGYNDEYGNQEWKEEYHTAPIAVDAGYLLQFINRFRVGIAIKNVGPDITGTFNDTTKETEKLPLMFATGFAYKDAFNQENLRVLDVSSEFSFSSLGLAYSSRVDNSIQTGIDLQFFRIFSAQLGYSLDLTYNNYSLSWGTGFSLFDHFDFNFFWEKYYGTNGYESYVKTGISTSFKRMLKWSKKDRRWWLD